MFEELNAQLTAAKDNLRKKEKYERLIVQTRESMQRLKTNQSELSQSLSKESQDVKKLESLSITGLFYTILGSKTEQLDKEVQEMLAVRLKYNACCDAITQLEREWRGHEAALLSVGNAEPEYAEILKRKERAILDLNSRKSQDLSALMEQSTDIEMRKKELQEALAAGEAVVTELDYAIQSLSSAEGWGTWDMLGGGIIATSIKHSRIDEAQTHAQNATYGLSRFQRELADVNISNTVDINIGSFNTFADYFFDGLIADWVVQSKVEQSMQSVRSTAENVAGVMHALNQQMKELLDQQISVDRELVELIERA